MLLSETAALDGRWFHILPVRGSLKLFFMWHWPWTVCSLSRSEKKAPRRAMLLLKGAKGPIRSN